MCSSVAIRGSCNVSWASDGRLDAESLNGGSGAIGGARRPPSNAIVHLRHVSLSYLAGGGREQLGFGTEAAGSAGPSGPGPVPPLSPVPELLLGERALQYVSCYAHVCQSLVDLAGTPFIVVGPKRSSDPFSVRSTCADILFRLVLSCSH